MATMNISLPDTLKAFIDDEVADKGFGTSSEYIRSLVRKEQQVERLRTLLLEGKMSSPGQPVDDAYFERLRQRVRDAASVK